MSSAALAHAIKTDVPAASAKLVFLLLADVANSEDGNAYPSIEYLVKYSGLDRKTVIKAVAGLLEWELIIDTGEKRGRTKSLKVYRIAGFEPATKYSMPPASSPKNGTGSKTGEAVPFLEGSSPVFPPKQSQKRNTEPSIEPSKNLKDRENQNAEGPAGLTISISGRAIESVRSMANGFDVLYLEKRFVDFCKGDGGVIPHDPDAAFIAWSKKFLSGKRFPGEPNEAIAEDALEKNASDLSTPHEANFALKSERDDWRKWLGEFYRNGWWQDYRGPAPGQPGCRAPADLIDYYSQRAATMAAKSPKGKKHATA